MLTHLEKWLLVAKRGSISRWKGNTQSTNISHALTCTHTYALDLWCWNFHTAAWIDCKTSHRLYAICFVVHHACQRVYYPNSLKRGPHLYSSKRAIYQCPNHCGLVVTCATQCIALVTGQATPATIKKQQRCKVAMYKLTDATTVARLNSGNLRSLAKNETKWLLRVRRTDNKDIRHKWNSTAARW